jgi:hypothetical protein
MGIRIPIAISARHAHLSQTTLDQVFGAGHQLQPRTWLSQTGQFAAQEAVSLVGPKGRLDNVRVMGPLRESRTRLSCHAQTRRHLASRRRYESRAILPARLASLWKGRWVVAPCRAESSVPAGTFT